MDFTGKVVIVTGGSSGIGAASAVLFAEHCAKLTIVGRNSERLQAVAQKCTAAKGNTPLCLELDLTLPGSCETVVNRTVENFGRIDVLVNCAGKLVIGSLFDETPDAFDEIINLNLRVPYFLTHKALPHLVKTKGNIVNIIGAMYTRIRPGFLPFLIAKAGLDRFTKSASVELASEGVRMNSVQPGLTRTNLFSNIGYDEEGLESAYERLAKLFPSNKVLESEEIARMVVFVASNLCPSINGANFNIDGATVFTL